MCPLANILVLLTHYTADSSGGLFQGPSWPYPITFHHCTISQHDHYSTSVLLRVTIIYPASLLPLAQFTLYIQTASWLTPITCLVSQSLVTFSQHHTDLPLFCHSSWRWNEYMVLKHGWQTSPCCTRSQVISFYMQSSLHHGLIWP